ncbi:MAG: hypothetical protein QCI38_08415, partial [Candidatus Thermoplasmatota archaeon]|nr:hypothetical protein [Candidatus Thermoplasmatota archaeon]
MAESKAQQAAANIKFSGDKDWTKTILIASAVVASVMILMGIVETMNPGTLPLGQYGTQPTVIGIDLNGSPIMGKVIDYDAPIRIAIIDGIILAAMAMMGPYGFYANSKMSKVKKIESYLPDFLRDVAEAGRFGMTLAEAIIVASSG